jgi:hypothetical protein
MIGLKWFGKRLSGMGLDDPREKPGVFWAVLSKRKGGFWSDLRFTHLVRKW